MPPYYSLATKYTFAQTMMRVKDPQKSLRFYRDLLGMTLLAESHHGDFSLYFLACANQNPVLAGKHRRTLTLDLKLPCICI